MIFDRISAFTIENSFRNLILVLTKIVKFKSYFWVTKKTDFLRTSNTVLDAFCRLSFAEISQSKAFFTAAVEKQIFAGNDLFSLLAGKQNTVKTKIDAFDDLLCGGLRLGETLLVSHQYAQSKEMEALVTNISNNILDSGNVIILETGSEIIRLYPM